MFQIILVLIIGLASIGWSSGSTWKNDSILSGGTITGDLTVDGAVYSTGTGVSYFSGGSVAIGTTDSANTLTIGGASPSVFVAPNVGTNSAIYFKSRYDGSTNGPTWYFQNDPGRVNANGDYLGEIYAQGRGSDGSLNNNATEIDFFTDGTAGVGHVPGGINFKTSTSGATATTKMTIKSSGYVGIGSTVPRGSLDVRSAPGEDGFIYGNGSQLTGITGGISQWTGTNPIYITGVNVGIGTAVPRQTLEVDGTLYVVGTGNVGIGIVNGTSLLDVAGGARSFIDGIEDALVKGDIESDANIYLGTGTTAGTVAGTGFLYAAGGIETDKSIYAGYVNTYFKQPDGGCTLQIPKNDGTGMDYVATTCPTGM